MCHCEKLRVGQSNLADGDFSIFTQQRPSTVLYLLGARLDHPRRVFGGIYHNAQCGWNRCSIVLIICEC